VTIIHLLGIDPGLVDTGAVLFQFETSRHSLQTSARRFDGGDATEIAEWVASLSPQPITFIERYRDRGTVFTTHNAMRNLEMQLREAIPGATLLDNSGVKRIVTKDLMVALGVWKFDILTNHQDLRSAARIALLGALRVPELNQVITEHLIALLDQEVTK